MNSTKLKVYIQAAIHGNEPAADQAAMALLGKMDLNQTWTASLLEKMDILMLPRYNVDGVHYFQRILANNLDPNREAIKLDRRQSRDIRRGFGEYGPHISIDLHEFSKSGIRVRESMSDSELPQPLQPSTAATTSMRQTLSSQVVSTPTFIQTSEQNFWRDSFRPWALDWNLTVSAGRPT